MNRRKLMFIALGVVLVGTTVAVSCRTTFMRFAYEGIGRDKWQQPEEVIRALEIEPGESIADLGAGSGYFTFWLADATGPGGKVYATDVDEGLLRYLIRRAEKKGIGNIESVIADYHDPLLLEGEIDLLFTSNTFHHIEDRSVYFANVKKYLSPTGRVAVIDYREGKHGTPCDVIKADMEEAGYSLAADHTFLERQCLLVFRPQGS